MVSHRTIEDIFDRRFRDTRDNWVGNCPFHDESTPSFYIHKDELVGHCFGCGIAGRLDVLVSRFLGISPQKARERLGLKSLPWLENYTYRVPPEPTYPQSWIRAWKRISNHPYLATRGFDREIVEHFGMRWDPVTKRVVWPLTLREQRVVGAVGRATDGREPKYLFYWNCDKGQSLWTAPSFWETSHDNVIVVEGILDCMWMWQNGLQNTVAPIGASLTKPQIAQLKEFDTVTLALDNDRAGKTGALKAGEALKSSCNVLYAQYPEHAKDANDLTREELQEVFSNPITPLQMKLCMS